MRLGAVTEQGGMNEVAMVLAKDSHSPPHRGTISADFWHMSEMGLDRHSAEQPRPGISTRPRT